MTFGRDARHAEIVDRRADRAGDVRAVRVLVHVGGVGARMVGLVFARAVDERDVGREVAAQRLREVRRDVRMVAVHAGVDDPDQHVLAAPAPSRRSRRLSRGSSSCPTGAVRAAPPRCCLRAGPLSAPLCQLQAFRGIPQLSHHLHGELRLRLGGAVPITRFGATPSIAAEEAALLEEVRIGRHDRSDSDPRVRVQDPAAGLR